MGCGASKPVATEVQTSPAAVNNSTIGAPAPEGLLKRQPSAPIIKIDANSDPSAVSTDNLVYRLPSIIPCISLSFHTVPRSFHFFLFRKKKVTKIRTECTLHDIPSVSDERIVMVHPFYALLYSLCIRCAFPYTLSEFHGTQ